MTFDLSDSVRLNNNNKKNVRIKLSIFIAIIEWIKMRHYFQYISKVLTFNFNFLDSVTFLSSNPFRRNPSCVSVIVGVNVEK